MAVVKKAIFIGKKTGTTWEKRKRRRTPGRRTGENTGRWKRKRVLNTKKQREDVRDVVCSSSSNFNIGDYHHNSDYKLCLPGSFLPPLITSTLTLM